MIYDSSPPRLEIEETTSKSTLPVLLPSFDSAVVVIIVVVVVVVVVVCSGDDWVIDAIASCGCWP